MSRGPLDKLLDLSVAPGFSRIGFSLRGLGSHPPIAGDLTGRVALVTGGSSGIGEAVAEGLLEAGATVHLLGRDDERTSRSVQRIVGRHPEARARLLPEICDIADQRDVRRFAEELLARRETLDLLVNNAGVLPARREHTRDGIELTFATNVLGPFLLTSLLLPALLAAAPSRVITVSSGGMYTAALNADDPQLEGREFDGSAFYAHTKRIEVVLNRLWSERHAADEIGFHAMHPGWADTAGLQRSLPRFRQIMRPVLRDAAEGADTILWLCSAERLEPDTGGFWHDRVPRPTHRLPWTVETAADRARIWNYCERLATPTSRRHGLAGAAH